MKYDTHSDTYHCLLVGGAGREEEEEGYMDLNLPPAYDADVENYLDVGPLRQGVENPNYERMDRFRNKKMPKESANSEVSISISTLKCFKGTKYIA